MKIIFLIAALVGHEGSSQIIVPFASMEECTRAANEYMVVMQNNGAPGWSGNGGVIVKTLCVEGKK